MHHELLRKHRKHPVSMLWPALSVVMTQTDVKLAAIGIGGGRRSAMVCRIEQRWQGREAGTSQKGIILLREDSLSGAWTQNTKHEKKDIPLIPSPRNRTRCSDQHNNGLGKGGKEGS